MGYRIGSFNMRDFNFAKNSPDEDGRRDFRKIAEIIAQEAFDVVALQEINSEPALTMLTNNFLNREYQNTTRSYKCVFGTGMPTHGSRDPERYGFIWNEKRLRLLTVRRGTNPGYYTNAGGYGLIRPPYYARFTARGMLGGSNFELRLVNTHIRDAVRKEDRIKEFDVLVKQVLPRICDHQEVSEDGEFMPAYTFLVGDYNLALTKGPNVQFRIDSITTNYTGRKRVFKTIQEDLTTLKHVAEQTDISECYANNYDHFTCEYEMLIKLKLQSNRVEALSKYFQNEINVSDKLKAYRAKVSDHVPIVMELDLK